MQLALPSAQNLGTPVGGRSKRLEPEDCQRSGIHRDARAFVYGRRDHGLSLVSHFDHGTILVIHVSQSCKTSSGFRGMLIL
jgi:hypothetical protein